MMPMYDGQENHYKKMLDLQEKLRKSEEERIRLEERFNLMVQESRNRHQACINRLRICYVDFLEEQKARDERNNKLRGKLDKIDTSLALMSAKTERLNILRKQYESYLLRVYGNQHTNGSVTADSGLESQNDQLNSPSPILSKSVQTIPRNLYPYPVNQEFSFNNYKYLPESDKENIEKQNILKKTREESGNLNTFSEDVVLPPSFEKSNDIVKHPIILPSYADIVWKYPNDMKIDSLEIKNDMKGNSRKSFGIIPPGEHDLDQALGKIKQYHKELLPDYNQELECNFEDIDLEQNTSGDLLNVSFAEDDLPLPGDEETKKIQNTLSGLRNLLETNPFENDSKNLFNGQSQARNSWAATLKKFSNMGMNDRTAKVHIDREEVQWPSKEIPNEEIDELAEERRLVAENRALLAAADEPILAGAPKMMAPIVIEDISDSDFKTENDGCIEDDYDDSVDIDSWMPDDLEPQIPKMQIQENIRDRLRRKLESIEEVEQTEDEEVKENKQSDLKNMYPVKAPAENSERITAEIHYDSSEILEDNNHFKVKDENKAFNKNGMYTNNELPTKDNNGQQKYRENSENPLNYYQQQNKNLQQNQYSNDANQQYIFEMNDAQNKNQEYCRNQEFNPKQLYDSNQLYQQIGSTGENENYKDDLQVNQELNNPETNQNNFSRNGNNNYLQQSLGQIHTDGNTPQQIDKDPSDNKLPQSNKKQQSIIDYQEQTKQNDRTNNKNTKRQEDSEPSVSKSSSSDAKKKMRKVASFRGLRSSSFDKKKKTSKDDSESSVQGSKSSSSDKKKKLVRQASESSIQGSKSSATDKKKKISKKSIIDSDTDSFIERNLSNTESDFDFN